MKPKEKLYETLGELIYAIAIADGVIQPSEIQKLEEILKYHEWGSQIKWSFDYETKKTPDLEKIYSKVINYCHSYGPAPEYEEFIDIIRNIAEISDGIDDNEQKVIANFSKDLIERFKADLERGENRYQ
ncbi:MAG: TerB family tellurite resistance protein [Bacteroidia bacterium]|nr:TerB family tellurite resistance protein [Bacteroidia bacterium]